MSMIKQIEIDGKQVSFKASAAIPRIYQYRKNKRLRKYSRDGSPLVPTKTG